MPEDRRLLSVDLRKRGEANEEEQECWIAQIEAAISYAKHARRDMGHHAIAGRGGHGLTGRPWARHRQ